MTTKRLFFAFQITAPWLSVPKGRILKEDSRHLTAAFLGNIDFDLLEPLLPKLPLPQFQVGFTGHFDKCLFLPPKHPRVVSWNAHISMHKDCEDYVLTLNQWLNDRGISTDLRLPWLPHVTIARAPFNLTHWEKAFTPLPFTCHALNLYESFPELVYKPIWSKKFQVPFEEIEHTADTAFHIHGETMEQIYENAFTALAFHEPGLIAYKEEAPSQEEHIVKKLNSALSQLDAEKGCSFKAVSHHGEITRDSSNQLQWEMIVDV